MAIYQLNGNSLSEIAIASFKNEQLLERQNLQKILRDRIDVIARDTMIIAEEFGNWTEGSRRIDLLGVDKEANIVVIELKRDESGGHMELQAIRYAAMVATLTCKQAIDIYRNYLKKRNIDKDPEKDLLSFLRWEDPSGGKFPTDVKIVLASADFSAELKTTVRWLIDNYAIDIRCVALRPYQIEGKIVLDIDQVVPVKGVEEYQVKVREQVEENKKAAKKARDYTKYIFNNERFDKNNLVHAVVRYYLQSNKRVTYDKLNEVFPWEFQGNKKQRVFVKFEDAKELINKCKGRKDPRHYLDEDMVLTTSDKMGH